MRVSLKAMRVNAELDQRKAAEMLGINRGTLQSWESNKTSPTMQQLLKICNIYHCSVGDIFMPDELAKS